jgi:hypothetical protein
MPGIPLNVPVTASNMPTWVRLAANAVNALIGIVPGLRSALDSLDTRVTTLETDVPAIDARVTDLEIAAPLPAFAYREVTANASFGASDCMISANATAGVVTLTLPALAQGKVFIGKKLDASVNAVTVSGAVNIDGSPSQSLTTQYQVIRLIGGATEWRRW